MTIAMAGLRGGRIGLNPDQERMNFVRDLIAGVLSEQNIASQLKGRAVPKTLTYVVNNSCNLKCRHCYLQVEQLTASVLQRHEWRPFLDSVWDSGVELICLSGKEIFLGSQGAEILSYLGEQKQRRRSPVRLGTITNGTLIYPHRDRILNAGLAYLDISVDGAEADHDAIRGAGSFALVRPNLEWAAQAFGSNLFVSHTLQKMNFLHVRDTVRTLDRLGVQSIGIGFYRMMSYTDPALRLTSEDLDLIFSRLHELEALPLEFPKTILLDLDITNMPALVAFMRSDWFQPDRLFCDAKDNFYVEYQLSNGIILQFRFTPFPSLVHQSARITPEGNYLASEDTVDTTLYRDKRIANVRDFACDFVAMHRYARESPRVNELLDDYLCNILPVIVEVYNDKVSQQLVGESGAVATSAKSVQYV